MNVPEPSKAAAKESGGMSLLEKSMPMPICPISSWLGSCSSAGWCW